MHESFYPLIRISVEDRMGHKRQVEITVKRLLCFGWSGRDREKVMDHIKEIARLGIPEPKTIPDLYIVPPYLVYTGDYIEVFTEMDSGEVEYVLLFDDQGNTYVTVGSDHTDRILERCNIEKSKQVYPKIMASQAWLLDDVLDHWDEMVLRSIIKENGRDKIYQEEKLSSLLRPETLIGITRENFETKNLIVFSGTIPTKGGEIKSTEFFQMELVDPVLGRSIKHSYRISKCKLRIRRL